MYLVHCSCNIFFSTFTKKDIKALFVTNKRFCGVREFDYLIVKKLAGDFNNKYVEYPMSTPKCRITFFEPCWLNCLSILREMAEICKDDSGFRENSLWCGYQIIWDLFPLKKLFEI